MINALIKGISIALDAEFENCEIHMEEIKQGLNGPCFFIQCLNPTKNLFLGKRYFRSNLFGIQYFPETDNKQEECNNVTEKMFDCLEYVTADGVTIRGIKMKSEVVDGVLNFFVNYDCFVYKVVDEELMEEFAEDTNVKG